ncbi:MAG TPA: InlB B-repeat-containing protein, partial [Acholeplasmataceae bacterium]|nr:InlB B-repeat-containing protein [Acholeplasmataceae bacterium]
MKKSFFVIFLMIFFVLFGCTKDQTVKVSFETNGGTAIADITELDDLLSGIPQTTKEGYTFAGWYEDQNFTTSFDPLEERESWEITLYAKWTANSTSYKVEYYQETLEGTYELIEDEDLNGVTGESVTATPKTYEGFTLNETHPNAVTSTSLPATGQATLKLYYDRNTYHVIIDEAGGTSVDDLDIMYGETITLPTLSRFGYTFVNWSSYTDTMPAHDINVTASWVELPKFDVTFDAHQGTVVADQSIYQGYLATEPTDPVRVGYAFAGWYLDLEGTEYSFQTPITSDIELHAKWTAILVDYDVEYYIEELNGTYTLDHTTTQQALTETVLTATPEVIQGFSEHTSHPLRVATGTVLGDGSLVLKLYYTRNT